MAVLQPARLLGNTILILAFNWGVAAEAQIISRSDFETGAVSPLKIQGATADSVTVVTSPVRAGRYAGRSLLRVTDAKVASGQRAEFVDPTPVSLGRVYWYGLSILADESFAIPAQKDGVLFQFHQQAKTGSPVLAFRVVAGTWKVTTDTGGKRRTLAVLPFEKGEWTDWVLRVKWANDTTGEWTIWRNGTQVVHEAGILTTYATENVGPYAKFGQYHTVDEAAQNTVYFDEYKLAGAESTYDDVAPGGAGSDRLPR